MEECLKNILKTKWFLHLNSICRKTIQFRFRILKTFKISIISDAPFSKKSLKICPIRKREKVKKEKIGKLTEGKRQKGSPGSCWRKIPNNRNAGKPESNTLRMGKVGRLQETFLLQKEIQNGNEINRILQFSLVYSLSPVRLFAILWTYCILTYLERGI